MGWFAKQHWSHARINTPVLVQVAAIAIISTRCLDLFMLFSMLGMGGVADFIHRSVQTWGMTLVFFASLMMLCVEFRCAFVILKGRNWGRWGYLASQVLAAAYLWAASLGFGYPELFSIPGETRREIFISLVLQKLPDMLVLMLLFIPAASRRFFRLQ